MAKNDVDILVKGQKPTTIYFNFIMIWIEERVAEKH